MAAMTEDKDDLIRQLVQRLRETVDENDKLKALVANLTEGATAHTVLQSLYRDPNQPTGHRIKAAQASAECRIPGSEAGRAALGFSR